MLLQTQRILRSTTPPGIGKGSATCARLTEKDLAGLNISSGMIATNGKRLKYLPGAGHNSMY